MSSRQEPLAHYSSINARGAAEAENSLQLILSLMVGSQDRIAAARGHMERGEVDKKVTQLGKAIAIIEGLRGSINHAEGAEIAGNLEALYDYMIRRLVEANASNDVESLNEVMGLMSEIRIAWEQVIVKDSGLTGV